MIDPARITAFDVETNAKERAFALQPCRYLTGDAWLTTCAVAYWQGEDIISEALIYPTPEQLSAWLDAILAAQQYVVCWNAPFDVAWLLAMDLLHPHLGIRAKVFRVMWLDGLLLYRHVINSPRYREEGRISLSLKPAVEKFLPEEAGYEEDIDYADETPEGLDKLVTYNRRDSTFTLKIVCNLIAEMPERMLRCALLEARSIPDVAESTVRGIKLNAEASAALGVKLEEQRRLAFITLKMRHPEVSEPILKSPKQLAKLLYETWNLPILKYTDPTKSKPNGSPSTDKEVLTQLAVTDDRAKFIHEYRDAEYCKAKFATGPAESLAYNGDGVSRPQFRIFGTYTGRGTYSSKTGKEEAPTGVAIHQWKRDPEYRAIIEPPEGYDLCEFDFAGQEFRWMAVESRDPQMLALCEPGEDAHAFMGARISNLDYRTLQAGAAEGDKAAKAKRQMGKVGNLSLQYRTSANTLVKVAAVQHKIKLTDVEAKAIWSTYRTTYRRVPDYWKAQVKKAKALGYVETLAGRRVQLGPASTWVFSDGEDASWSHESTAINFPIQGVGGDQKYLAILCMHELCLKYDARFYFELHDGIFYVCPKHCSEAFAHEAKALLSNLPYKRAWGVDLPIMFPVDGKRGPTWGALKEFH